MGQPTCQPNCVKHALSCSLVLPLQESLRPPRTGFRPKPSIFLRKRPSGVSPGPPRGGREIARAGCLPEALLSTPAYYTSRETAQTISCTCLVPHGTISQCACDAGTVKHCTSCPKCVAGQQVTYTFWLIALSQSAMRAPSPTTQRAATTVAVHTGFAILDIAEAFLTHESIVNARACTCDVSR